MPERIATRRSIHLAGVAIAVALVACSDARLKSLTAGISRDSTLHVMGTSPSGQDSLPNTYFQGKYLSKGQQLEVLFYPRDNASHRGETIDQKELSPIVLKNDTLAGWGWAFWDSVAKEHNIPAQPYKP